MTHPPLLVEGAVVLASAVAEPLADAAVLVEDGRVAAVGDAAALRAAHPTVDRLGGPDALVMPGLVNAHQHAEGVSTAQLGFVDGPFEPWMAGMHALPAVDPYLTTLAKSVQMMTSGVTTHVHMHFPAKWGYDADPDAYVTDLEASLEAHRAAGLRVTFAPYWRDRATFVYDDDERFLRTLPTALAEAARDRFGGRDVPNGVYLEAVRTLHRRLVHDPLIRVQLAIAAPQWASDDLLTAVATEEQALGVGIHLHALESRRQRDWGDLVHGGRELHRLADLGVLGERTTIAHGVYLRDSDIDLLAARGAAVAHNVSSNLRLACGIAPVRRLVARGVPVGLGTDDMTLGDDDDMLAEVRTADAVQRVWPGPEPILGARDMLAMAWDGGARVAGLTGRVGRLERGWHGDLVVLDLPALRGGHRTGLPPHDLVVTRAARRHVRAVVVGGRVVVRDGRPVHVDAVALEAALVEAADAARAAADPELPALLDRMLPFLLRHPPPVG